MADDNQTLNAPEASGATQAPRPFKRPHVAHSDVAAGAKPFNPRTMKREVAKIDLAAGHKPVDPRHHRPVIHSDKPAEK